MPNALAAASSPYLLQHAGNPVDWLPWGDEAFARARALDRPVFLSIGYSTCHWCHVMARESFEDPALAALLNTHFVPVKVDREERPDVDRVYMTYVQAVTGHGGWPLSVWLTPDRRPFYGGTYFPPRDTGGRPGFGRVLEALAGAWHDQRAELEAEGERILRALAEPVSAGSPPGGERPLAERGAAALDAAFRHARTTFDTAHGGFGGAPKFPRACQLSFLFRYAAFRGPVSPEGREAVRMADATLRAMTRGGIHDHVGGGFHRYSVDAAWFVPHFEKMLYDQAQIALNCLEARQATGDERHAWTARAILDYVARDLTGPAGEGYTAEDADSADASGHHAEGAFYLWEAAELRSRLGDDFPLVAAHFGVVDGGNVPPELDPHGEFRGRNLLAQRAPLAATAARLGLEPAAASERLVAALVRLREARAPRPRPHLDDKVLAAHNGLLLSALARAHTQLHDEGRHLAAALRVAAFLRRELHDEAAGTLRRSWRAPGAATPGPGFAEDYACVIQGLLDLYEAGFDWRWLAWAERLQARMDALFWDEARGGYFDAAADPSLVLRLKEDYDGAEPAPSSVAALNLLRFAALLGDDGTVPAPGGFRDRALRTLEAFRDRWERAPHALPQMLGALELALAPPRHVVLAGDPAAADFRALAAVLAEGPGPRRAVLAADGGEGQRWLAARAPWIAGMRPHEGHATAYVCEDHRCAAPVHDPAALRRLLAPAATGGLAP